MEAQTMGSADLSQLPEPRLSPGVRQNVAVSLDVSLAPGELPTLGPALLYHYTDPGGLQGIIERQSLWAGDVWFMNDAREARYGIEVFERALNSMCQSLLTNVPPTWRPSSN
jgi:hypothetical protein